MKEKSQAMSYIEECPLPAQLPDIDTVDCGFRLDQINRLMLHRSIAEVGIGGPPVVPLTDLDMVDIATYQALLAATAEDKFMLTPLFAECVIPPSESSFTGGDTNETIGGVPEYNGENVAQATASFHGTPPTIIEQLQRYAQYSDATRGYVGLRAFFFNENNQVFYSKDANGVITGIPLFSFVVSNPGTEGLKTQTKNTLRFALPHYWAKGLTVANLDFDYKALVNVPGA